MIDGGFGMASGIAFAFGETGIAVAAGFGVVKFLVDMFYPDPATGVVDPLTQLPDMADLTNALTDLENRLDATIWADFEANYKADVDTMSSAILMALSHVGTRDKTTNLMPGDTTVWVAGDNVKFFDPVCDNPAKLIDTMNWIEGSGAYHYRSIPLYSLTVGVFLNYCKVGVMWETNNNIRDYLTRKSTYDTANLNFTNNDQIWTAQSKIWKSYSLNPTVWQNQNPGQPTPTDPGVEPLKPTLTAPVVPEDGDFAVGSDFIDAISKVASFRSYLGKLKSVFAVALRDNLPRRIKYLDGILKQYAADKVTRQTAVDNRKADFSVKTNFANGAATYNWYDSETGDSGDAEDDIVLANLQMTVAQGAVAQTIWNTQTTSLFIDDLDDSDITTLTATLADWRTAYTVFMGT